ncbi:MAG: OmpA family protein, partial [Pseudomonadota bacterium]
NDNQSNLVLGQQRADAVANALIMNGVNSNQLRTVSFGEERPFCVSSDLDCWKSNSRARIVLTASG